MSANLALATPVLSSDPERRFYSPQMQRQLLGEAGNPHILRWLEVIRPVAADTDMLRVLDVFREHQQEHFFPVLDDDGRPLGLVCERSLKNYVYSRYGMALLANRGQPRLLGQFISECPVVEADAELQQVLQAAHCHPNGEGVLVVWQGQYLGFVRASALVELAHELQMETARQHNLELDRKNRDIQAVLQNMRQGICTLMPDLTLHSEYSVHLGELLECRELAGAPLRSVLLEHCEMGNDRLQQIETALSASIGQDALMFECNAHLLPDHLQARLGGQSKRFELHWRPLLDSDGQVERMLLVLRDVTRLHQLQQQAASQQRELQLLGEILGCGEPRFVGFLQQAQNGVESLQAQLDKGEALQIDSTYRLLHTLKGNARTLGLLAVTDSLHEAEQCLQDARNSTGTTLQDVVSLTDALQQAEAALQDYRRLFELRLRGFVRSDSARSEGYWLDDDLWQQLQQLARRQPDARLQRLLARQPMPLLEQVLDQQLQGLPHICDELGKPQPQVSLSGHLQGLRISTECAASLADCMTHLLRNSMDHGIEPVAQRRASGKPEQGRLQIHVDCDAAGIRLCLQDDGRGLALDALRRKAEARGELEPGQACSDEQLAALIFHSGLSTAAALTMLSGRGVGMDAVRASLAAPGGDIRVYWQQHTDAGQPVRAFGLEIRLPLLD